MLVEDQRKPSQARAFINSLTRVLTRDTDQRTNQSTNQSTDQFTNQISNESRLPDLEVGNMAAVQVHRQSTYMCTIQ
jgi:hypothetical protein